MFSRYLNLSLLCTGVAIASILAIASAVAQTYSAQPIKVVIGFGPGSAADVQELIALAKSKPETLTFGSSGYATASYMRQSCSMPMRAPPSSWCPIRAAATRLSRTCSRAVLR